jgi:hypothetical protein
VQREPLVVGNGDFGGGDREGATSVSEQKRPPAPPGVKTTGCGHGIGALPRNIRPRGGLKLSGEELTMCGRSGGRPENEGVHLMAKLLAVCALIVALAAPAALAADPVPADYKNAAKYCKALRESKGVEGFQTLYGKNGNKKNAYGKCVSSTAKAKAEKREDAEEQNAATAACKAEQSGNAAKFTQDYKNFGQCVKSKKGSS